MRLLQYIAISVVLAGCTLTSSAQVPSGLFRARIVDAKGKTIPRVSFTFESPNFTRRVNSTPAGTIGIRLPVGAYTITLSKAGFAEYQLRGVEVRRGGYVSYVVTLKPLTVQSVHRAAEVIARATHNKSLDASGGCVFRN
jgi:hypothetical protein